MRIFNNDNKHTNKRSKGAITMFLFIIGVLLFAEGMFLTNAIHRMGVTRREVKELIIIKATNFMEDVKRGLEDAVEYSVYKASNDVLLGGGFCEHDLDQSSDIYCYEECKIPYDTPTFECVPWWRIYDDTHEPTSLLFREYVTNRTFQRFEEYARAYRRVSDWELNTPSYCPRPEGTSLIEFTQSSEPSAYAKLEHKDIEGNDMRMNYFGGFFYLEDNSTFIDTVDVTSYSLFELTVSTFAGNDYIADKFDEADSEMPNEWCEMTPEGYCNLDVTESDCQLSYGDTCFGDNDPDSNCCWGEDCCCNDIYFEYRCEDNLPACESYLYDYCRLEYDILLGFDEADYDFNGVITADEKYNYTLQSKLDTPEIVTDIYGNEFTVELSRDSPTDCLKTGHDSDVGYGSYFNVHWTDQFTAPDDSECELKEECKAVECPMFGPCDPKCCEWIPEGPHLICDRKIFKCEHSVDFRCDLIKDDTTGFECGCAAYCTGSEDSCGECASITSTNGWRSGRCPKDPPWVQTSSDTWVVDCPNPTECCAEQWICEEDYDDWCEGFNTYDCGSDPGCTNACCEGGTPPGCECSECELEESCRAIECLMFGPCMSECCEWIQEGPHRICVRKDFQCESCCNGECEPKDCSDFNPSGNSCPCGCDYDEDWEHRIELKCRPEASACGYECCIQTKNIYEDVVCSYNYFGTVNATIKVSDTEYSYPIFYKWTNLELPFYVASGNTREPAYMCDAARTDDDPITPEIEFPEWQYCKVGA